MVIMFYCYLKDIKKEREKLAKLSQKSGVSVFQETDYRKLSFRNHYDNITQNKYNVLINNKFFFCY
ncbi:hypothetical protein AM596_16070 [Clostridium perfringens CP4]|nr:hypothetical protein AM596_16070 [Clostridium perfringens CP4]